MAVAETASDRAGIHITDAVDNGRELVRMLDALDIFGRTALEINEPGWRATALGVLSQTHDYARFLVSDLTSVREAYEEAWG